MRQGAAAVGSVVFFVVAPGVVTGVVPWWLSDGWSAGGSWNWSVGALGWVVVIGSAALLVHSFGRFVAQGRGTPAPPAPTEHLVVTGAYRYVRNPMYVAVVALILAQGLVLARPLLLGYGLVAWAVMAVFVRTYEEPTLRRQFGSEYEVYRRGVRAWIPGLRAYEAAARPADGA